MPNNAQSRIVFDLDILATNPHDHIRLAGVRKFHMTAGPREHILEVWLSDVVEPDAMKQHRQLIYAPDQTVYLTPIVMEETAHD